MDKSISDIRVSILVNEYYKQIEAYRSRYRTLANFPYLTNDQFVQFFNQKKLEARSHIRMLSLALLCEYISVGLNDGLSKKVSAIAYQDEHSFEGIRLDDPLSYLAFKIHLNKEEINLSSTENIDHFESFLILEREFRNEGKFHDVLHLLFETKGSLFETFIQQFPKRMNYTDFWNSLYSVTHPTQKLGNKKQVFLKIVSLLNFINEMAGFIRGTQTQFLSSAFWHYFKPFFISVGLISLALKEFTKALGKIDIFKTVDSVQDITKDEKLLITEEAANNLEITISNINWVTNESNHRSLIEFIQSLDEMEQSVVTTSGYFEESADIDINMLRSHLG